MIAAIHQPNFLPWLGYLDRMRRADVFIVLDHVQFERRNYQNRTRIRLDGHGHWLTVPVHQHSRQERILDKRIDNPAPGERGWAADLGRTLRHAYRDAPFLERYLTPLRELLDARPESLVELDLAMLDLLRTAFAIDTPIVRSSRLGVDGAKSALILNLCRAVGADAYLAGMGGSRAYLDGEAFADAGIAIDWQDFAHPRYRQCGGGEFLPGLSAIDLLFNLGPESRQLLAAPPPPRPAVVAERRELSYS
ncbi:MAG TPA: WbqC family protein [Azospira sp.]|nr:WbqC family protein [Azospira sp.]